MTNEDGMKDIDMALIRLDKPNECREERQFAGTTLAVIEVDSSLIVAAAPASGLLDPCRDLPLGNHRSQADSGAQILRIHLTETNHPDYHVLRLENIAIIRNHCVALGHHDIAQTVSLNKTPHLFMPISLGGTVRLCLGFHVPVSDKAYMPRFGLMI